MSLDTAPFSTRSTPFATITDQMRADPLFLGGAIALALLIVPLTLAYGLETRSFQGINPWIKPIKFALSLSAYLATLALAAPLMPQGFLQRRSVQIFQGVVLFWIAVEMVWIGGAAAMATASHFNTSSRLSAAIYQTMGLGATTLTSACLIWGIAIWRRNTDTLSRGIAAAFAATFVMTMFFASYMSSQTGHHVGPSNTDAGGMWLLGWSREVGDLRVAHFFATHTMQVIPLVLLVAAAWRPLPRWTIWAPLTLYAIFTTATWWQAVAGQPFLPAL